MISLLNQQTDDLTNIYESNPDDLQQTNRQNVITNLQEAHVIIEKLISRTHHQKHVTTSYELRQVRSAITSLLAELENNNLDTFNTKQGNLDELYGAEKYFMQCSTNLLESIMVADKSPDLTDISQLNNAINTLQKSSNDRIISTHAHRNEYHNRIIAAHDAALEIGQDVSSNTKEWECEEENISDPPELGTETLSKLYNYINILEQKYSKYRPEISSNGDYIADKTWKVELGKGSIRGIIKNGILKTPLVFDTYWHPTNDMRDIIQYVQSKAKDVGKNQQKSLCLINDIWESEIKKWAAGFIHQRMVLFLYDLQTGELICNEALEPVQCFKYWHSIETDWVSLDERLNDFITGMEYFTMSDILKQFGLNVNGAKTLIDILVKKGIVINVRFGSTTPTYIRIKSAARL